MEPAVDLSLHPPQPHSQTLLVVNKLLTTTAEQLNAFGSQCEEKLIAMHYKMQRLETGVKLLESKLSSLPGASTSAPTSSSTAAASTVPTPTPTAATPEGTAATQGDPTQAVAAEAPAAAAEAPAEVQAGPKVKDDPRFAKYFKMVNFGVPKQVVSLKFQQETGCDPALLDTPDAPAPPGAPADEDDSDEDDD
jgi:WASH complex subunit CCDC53